MKCVKYNITTFPQANENKSRLPIKKRKLRDNFGLTCNEPLPKKMSGFCRSHQAATDPFNETVLSRSTTVTLEAITKDLSKVMSTDVDKANRKILLLETKNRWRNKLGLSKIQFSTGLWLLARNKANATFQSKINEIPSSPILVKSQRDLTDTEGLVILADTTKSIVNSQPTFTSPNYTSSEGLVKGPKIHPVMERQKSWSKVLPTGILSLEPYCFWG